MSMEIVKNSSAPIIIQSESNSSPNQSRSLYVMYEGGRQCLMILDDVGASSNSEGSHGDSIKNKPDGGGTKVNNDAEPYCTENELIWGKWNDTKKRTELNVQNSLIRRLYAERHKQVDSHLEKDIVILTSLYHGIDRVVRGIVAGYEASWHKNCKIRHENDDLLYAEDCLWPIVNNSIRDYFSISVVKEKVDKILSHFNDIALKVVNE